jgi:formate dehydrogenase subunit gamma
MFWALPLLAAIICAVHAARRAFRHPTPSVQGERSSRGREGAPSPSDWEEPLPKKVVLRYTVPQRLFHWANAVTCIVLLISGLAIFSPGLFPGSTTTAAWFALHRWFAVVLMLGIFFHVVYDAYIQDAWGFMWFGRDAAGQLGQIARNFLGLSPVYPKYGKYHPMQMGSHWMMAGSVFALVVTGLILWRPARIVLPLDLLGLDWEFIFLCRILHGFLASALMALIIGHVYFAVVVKKNWIISKTMITGKIDYDYYVTFHEIAAERSVQRRRR